MEDWFDQYGQWVALLFLVLWGVFRIAAIGKKRQ